jgi:hypothetical protein
MYRFFARYRLTVLDRDLLRAEDEARDLWSTIGGMATASPLSLALSLVFGLGQFAAGIGVTRWTLVALRWRRANYFVLLLIALWFACSGLAELFVSGMEALHQSAGWPTAAAFALWRGRADTALFTATLILSLSLLVYLAARFAVTRRAGTTSNTE